MSSFSADYDSVKARLSEYGQEHLLAFYESLSPSERTSLLSEISALDLASLFGKILPNVVAPTDSVASSSLAPFPPSRTCLLPSDPSSSSPLLPLPSLSSSRSHLSAKSVGCILLAGGQGTRLGHSGTKGTFRLALPSGRTLFDIIVERGIAIGCEVWYVMTSPMNDAETREYFKSKDFYGIGEGSFRFFQQGVLPALGLTTGGSGAHPLIQLSSPSSLCLSPDGNGGLYPALLRGGLLSEMASSGVQHLHAFSVDNPLVLPADPAFLGYCVAAGADCGNKVLWKRDAGEKVGVMCVEASSGRPRVVEYSDMSDEVKGRRDQEGRLAFGAGNICNHYYSYEFLDKAAREVGGGDVPYHCAIKSIPSVDVATGLMKNEKGMKLETFIFDVFPLSKNMAVLEVAREEEFAPVKNKDDDDPNVKVDDSPRVTVDMISALSKSWVAARGGEILSPDDFGVLKLRLASMGVLEISPRVCWGRREGFDKISEEMLRKVMQTKDGEALYLE